MYLDDQPTERPTRPTNIELFHGIQNISKLGEHVFILSTVMFSWSWSFPPALVNPPWVQTPPQAQYGISTMFESMIPTLNASNTKCSCNFPQLIFAIQNNEKSDVFYVVHNVWPSLKT